MSVVVKQTLYNTQLIKLKHVQDDELWREILAFRGFDSSYQEIYAGFVPVNYQSLIPNGGLCVSARVNNVFLVKEYLRLGATNARDAFECAIMARSFNAFIVLAKRLYPRKTRNVIFFHEFKIVMYHRLEAFPSALKLAKNITRKWLIKRIKRLNRDYNIKLMLEIANAAHKV